MRAEFRNAIERAALELATAEQVEMRYQLEADVRRLQAEREEELEKQEWERILRMVEKDVEEETDEELGPWELTPDLLEEVDDVLGDVPKTAADYLRIALGDNATGMDIVGDMNVLDEDLVQNAFDAAIEQQKGKEPRSMLSFLGLDSSSLTKSVYSGDGARLSGMPFNPTRDSGLSSGGDGWSDDTSDEARKQRIEKQIEEDYNFLVARSTMLAHAAYKQGRSPFPNKGHKVPWELVERKVLHLQNSILRVRDPPSDGSVCGSVEDDVRAALRLPETSMWVGSKANPREGTMEGKGGDKATDTQGSSRLLSSVMSDVVGAGDAKRSNKTKESVVVSIGAQGVDVQRAPMSRCSRALSLLWRCSCWLVCILLIKAAS